MSRPIRILVSIGSMACALLLACSGSDDETGSKSAGSTDGGPLPMCPGATPAPEEPPSGACADAGSCVTNTVEHCAGGGVGAQKGYTCTCSDGEWTCELSFQTLGICPHPPEDAGSG
jgi:hypothetical protein